MLKAVNALRAYALRLTISIIDFTPRSMINKMHEKDQDHIQPGLPHRLPYR